MADKHITRSELIYVLQRERDYYTHLSWHDRHTNAIVSLLIAAATLCVNMFVTKSCWGLLIPCIGLLYHFWTMCRLEQHVPVPYKVYGYCRSNNTKNDDGETWTPIGDPLYMTWGHVYDEKGQGVYATEYFQ